MSRLREEQTRQTTGSLMSSIYVAPLSSTRGCFHTSIGKRHHHQRLHQVHQSLCVVGHLVQREPRVQVDHHVLEAAECGVVELLHLGHRRGQPLVVALLLGGQAPVGEPLQVGELSG